MNVTEYLQKWSVSYRDDMLGNIMPFWLKHGLDLRNGGVYTCLDRDGSLIDTTKSVWFQGRFAFTCSYAYNHIEQNPEWRFRFSGFGRFRFFRRSFFGLYPRRGG